MNQPGNSARRFDLAAPLVFTLTIAFAVRLYTALLFPNMIWPDEIFQTLEQAHRLAFGNGVIPWEYRAGTRSWILPGILAGVMKISRGLGDGSAGYLLGVKIFLCLASLVPVATAFFWGNRVGGRSTALVAGLTGALWFELIYFAPKGLYEVAAATLLLPALYFSWFDDRDNRRLLLAGALMGLVLALRIHLAPALCIALLYIALVRGIRGWPWLFGGIAVTFGASGLLDFITWDYPFQSAWYNVYINVVRDKSSQFGTSPWFAYLSIMSGVWGAATLPILALITLSARRNLLLVLVAVTVVLSHSVIGHKEYRFLFPAMPLIFLLVGLGLGELIRLISTRVRSGWLPPLLASCIVTLTGAVSLGIAGEFDGARTQSALKHDKNIHWHANRGPLVQFDRISTDTSACGIAIHRLHWSLSGGYTHLHRDIPLFILADDADIPRLSSHFNFLLVGGKPLSNPVGNLALLDCVDSYCLYKRPGICTALPGYHINDELASRNQ